MMGILKPLFIAVFLPIGVPFLVVGFIANFAVSSVCGGWRLYISLYKSVWGK